MIYTVTVNPALDYVMKFDEIQPASVNRTANYAFLAGGKGINVSQVLNQLGVANTAWGFVGGFTGRELVRQLNVKHIVSDFVQISDNTRINVKLSAKAETELNATGPKITTQEMAAFKIRLSDIKPGDIVVMSGSLVPSLPQNFYQQLIPEIKKRGGEFVVDTTGEALLATLSNQPLVIKPNQHELAALFNTTFKTDDEMLSQAQVLLSKGAQNVMISMAAKGAYLVTKSHLYHAKAAIGTPVNSVGAGDSMIAGFVGTYFKTQDVVRSFQVGMACGGATAFTKDIAVKSQIEVVLPQIKVVKLA